MHYCVYRCSHVTLHIPERTHLHDITTKIPVPCITAQSSRQSQSRKTLRLYPGVRAERVIPHPILFSASWGAMGNHLMGASRETSRVRVHATATQLTAHRAAASGGSRSASQLDVARVDEVSPTPNRYMCSRFLTSVYPPVVGPRPWKRLAIPPLGALTPRPL